MVFQVSVCVIWQGLSCGVSSQCVRLGEALAVVFKVSVCVIWQGLSCGVSSQCVCVCDLARPQLRCFKSVSV